MDRCSFNIILPVWKQQGNTPFVCVVLTQAWLEILYGFGVEFSEAQTSSHDSLRSQDLFKLRQGETQMQEVDMRTFKPRIETYMALKSDVFVCYLLYPCQSQFASSCGSTLCSFPFSCM